MVCYRRIFLISLFLLSTNILKSIDACNLAENSINNCHNLIDDCDQDTKSLIRIVERKSISIFNNIINLMYKCDKYEDFWNYRKKNLSLYMLSSGKIVNILKARRDVLTLIDKKLEFFENKKKEYAIFAGNLYKLAEVFIDGSNLDIKEGDINNFLNEFTKKIDSILPKNYSESYFIDERKELKKNMPDNKKEELRKKYYLAGAGTILALVLVIKYRKVLGNFVVNLWSNQIVKPIRSLRDWFLLDTSKDDFLSLSQEEMLVDLEAQKGVIKDKIIDLAIELDPKVNKATLGMIMKKAKEAGVEGIVAKCIKKGRGNETRVIQAKTKPGWIEWLFFGDKVSEVLGMSAKGKLLETEIKVLLSRLVVTKLLADAKDGIDSNKITMILGSMMPIVLTSFGVYKIFSKSYELYRGIPKKKKDIDDMMLKISAIINKNISRKSFNAQDQGFLCYYVHRCKKSLDVVAEHLRPNILADLSYISSSLNLMYEKMQILQSLKIMLYVK